MSLTLLLWAFQSTRPVRGGTSRHSAFMTYGIFQSTRPVRGGTLEETTASSRTAFQSTRPVRGGTRTILTKTVSKYDFNPPAPCGAGLFQGRGYDVRGDFNPPAPCGAGRNSLPLSVVMLLFQSTRPVRGGTLLKFRLFIWTLFQSTRPVRGGTIVLDLFAGSGTFQSTRPVRGGTPTEGKIPA